jgi:exodeoxyribonuclease VII small subunit
MKTENLSYDQAMLELEQLVGELEAGNIGIDEISAKIKRSSSLIEFCKLKLQSTQEDVNRIIGELDHKSVG